MDVTHIELHQGAAAAEVAGARLKGHHGTHGGHQRIEPPNW